MKNDIVLAGVGGQGILSIATVVGQAAVGNDLYIKQSEVHGMSQRGGAVYAHLRLSSLPVSSDLIPFGKADLILSVEPMEALRYLPYLAPDGWLVTNTRAFINTVNYPEQETLISKLNSLKNRILIDADALALECGSSKASNMVMLGVAAPFIKIELKDLEKSIVAIFEGKGSDTVDMNVRALHAGYTEAKKILNI